MAKHQIIQVGSGGWGQSWLEFIHNSEQWELAGLVSRGGENLRKAQEQWDIPDERCFPSLEQALEEPGEVVLITAPHHLHVSMAKKALQAGRHALIEKPLSDDFEDAKAFGKLLEENGQQAWVSQNFRFREGLWQLHRSLAEGTIGDLLSIRLNFRRGGNRKPSPWSQQWRLEQWSFLMNELIIHHFDMCRFVTGRDAEWVFCHGWTPPWIETPGPESCAAVIGLEGGKTLEFSGRSRSLCGPTTEFDGDWLLQTDRGCAVWCGGAAEWDLAEGEQGSLCTVEGFPGFDRGGVLTDLAAALEGRSPAILPTVQDNLKSLAMVFAAIRSTQEHRVVELAEFLGD